ncbi:hypothetical protein CRUP_025694 [Coryphaenoides rupestris]|nr:hypothetical protein CRUP_025694 [Coryphaenoides rupestris]
MSPVHTPAPQPATLRQPPARQGPSALPPASNNVEHLNVNQIQVVVRRSSTPNVTEETTYFLPRNAVADAGTNTEPPVVCCPLLRRSECLPGGNLFGITVLFICSVTAGKLEHPVVTDAVYINNRWSASLRNIALAIILARAGLGLDPSALQKLKGVCMRVACGPCLIEASTVALVSHFLMGLPWVGGGMLAGVLLGFLIQYFPSVDQKHLVMKRSFLVLGLSVFSVFGSGVAGFPGSGGLCTLVLAFLAGLGWGKDKMHVEEVVGSAWDVFQPLLFGLIGAEIRVSQLEGHTVARIKGDAVLERYGMDVLTVAVLSILLTAPVGALAIGLAGPRLLQKPKSPSWGEPIKHNLSSFLLGTAAATDGDDETPVSYESTL